MSREGLVDRGSNSSFPGHSAVFEYETCSLFWETSCSATRCLRKRYRSTPCAGASGDYRPVSSTISLASREYLWENIWTSLLRLASSAPLLLLFSKHWTLRLWIDYCGLTNTTSTLFCFLILLLCGVAIFTNLHPRNASHRIKVHEGDQDNTVFNTPLCHFDLLVMPFGSTNTPAAFQTMTYH